MVELLVVAAVITILSVALLFSQNKFSSSTLLRSLGYSVALTVRQAQVYGTTVRGVGSTATTFARGYGASVDSGDLTRMYLFADLNGNGLLDTSPTDERLAAGGTLVMGRGYTINSFCAVRSSGAQDCYPQGVSGGSAITSLSLYFKRPEPDACIASSAQAGACAPGATAQYTSAYIQVASTNNADVRIVRITNTGQIVVCQLGANPLTC